MEFLPNPYCCVHRGTIYNDQTHISLEIYINAVYYHRSSEDGKLKTGEGEVVGFNLLVLRHKDKNVCLVNIYCKVNHLAIPLL